MTEKPKVLILGGVGFIGRNLVEYLVNKNCTSKIRVADRKLPQLSWLNERHKEAFKKVEFKHANLLNSKSVESVFRDENGGFDFVINCAGETRLGQSEPVYKDGVVKLSMTCAREAAKHNVKRYIEISSGQLINQGKKTHSGLSEDDCCDGWTQIAKFKLQVEQELKSLTELNFVVVRPAIVYGPGDMQGLTPRLIIGAIYKYMKEKMQLLWSRDLSMNTVHVHDVCSAMWFLCEHGKQAEIYHVVDHSNTTQGKIGDLVSEIFNINHDYLGSMASTLAKMKMSEVVEDINEKHMVPWGEACLKDNILSTPLTPFLDEELLYNKPVKLNGSRLEALNFQYEKPDIRLDLLKEVVDDYVKLGLFPPSLAEGKQR